MAADMIETRKGKDARKAKMLSRIEIAPNGKKKLLSLSFASEVTGRVAFPVGRETDRFGDELYQAYRMLGNGMRYDSELTEAEVESVHLAAKHVKAMAAGEIAASEYTAEILLAASRAIQGYAQRRDKKFYDQGWESPGVPRPGFEHLLNTLRK